MRTLDGRRGFVTTRPCAAPAQGRPRPVVLWEQVNGILDPAQRSATPTATFVRWSDEMGLLWSSKDELPGGGSFASASISRGR